MSLSILGLSRSDNLKLQAEVDDIIREKGITDIFRESLETGYRAFVDKLQNNVYDTVVGKYVEKEEQKSKAKIATEITQEYLPLFIIAVILIYIFFKKGIK